MLRGFLVIAAYLCLTGGFVAAVVDGARSIGTGALSLTYAEDVLRPRLPGLQGALDKVSPWLWDPLAVQIMRAPLGLLLGMAGLLLLLMVRRRAGYERFAGFE